MAFSTQQITAQFQGIIKVPMYIPPYEAAFSALYNSTGIVGWSFTNSPWPFIRFRNSEANGGILSVTCGLLSAINLDSIQFNPTLGGNSWGGGGSGDITYYGGIWGGSPSVTGGPVFHWATGELLIGFGNQTPKYITANETSGPLAGTVSALGSNSTYPLITAGGVSFVQLYNNFPNGKYGGSGVSVYGGGAFGSLDFFGNGFAPNSGAGVIFCVFLDFPNSNNITCGVGGGFTNGPQLYDQNNAILSQVSFDNVKVNNTFNGTVGSVTGATLWPKGFIFVGHGADPSITFGSNNAIILLSKDGKKYWLVQLYPQSTQATGDLIANGGGLNIIVDPTGIMYASQVNAPSNIYNSFGLNLPFFIPPPLDIHGLPGIPLPCPPFCDAGGYDFPA